MNLDSCLLSQSPPTLPPRWSSEDTLLIAQRVYCHVSRGSSSPRSIETSYCSAGQVRVKTGYGAAYTQQVHRQEPAAPHTLYFYSNDGSFSCQGTATVLACRPPPSVCRIFQCEETCQRLTAGWHLAAEGSAVLWQLLSLWLTCRIGRERMFLLQRLHCPYLCPPVLWMQLYFFEKLNFVKCWQLYWGNMSLAGVQSFQSLFEFSGRHIRCLES